MLAIVLCAISLRAPAQEAPAAPHRPRVALVLSGGGARGFAHIGVLRVLRDMRVPIDMVVGTSMGSVIGGAYAAGASVRELDALARHTDWDSVVADRPARDDLAFRRREEDQLLPSRIEFGLTRDGITLPPAAAGNASLEAALNKVLPPGTRDKPVNELALPFRSVASDLVSGELVDLVDTPLFITMRASLAVPGVFAPVRIKHRLVVDGGLVRNLPVDMARAMGADVVIAVNVGTPLAPEKELRSAIGVAQQMLNILTEQNVQRSIRELRPEDILIAPDLSGVSFLDFHNVDKAIRAGEAAAKALAPRLQALAVPQDEYAVLENRRLAAPPLTDTPLPLASLEVQSSGNINARTLAAQTGLEQGQPVTKEQVRQSVDALYGRGDVARLDTEISDEAGKRNVLVKATEAEWAGSRLRVGLELASDFNDTNSFAIKVMHVKTSINDWGAELRTVGAVGNTRMLGTQFWQPLGAGSPWYVAPTMAYGASAADIFTDGRRTSRVAYNTASASMIFGRQLGNWGDLQLGFTRQKVGVAQAIPADPTASVQHVFDTTEVLHYRVDTLDSLGFPSRGALVDLQLERSPTVTTKGLASSSVVGLAAFNAGEWAGHLYGEWAHAQQGTAPLALGGFLRLSGTTDGSVQARSIVFTRLAMARRIGYLPSTLGGAVRAGFSLEAGGGYDRDFRSPSIFSKAGSAYLSVDTRFGPAYLAAGATKDGNHTLYLFLGPVW